MTTTLEKAEAEAAARTAFEGILRAVAKEELDPAALLSVFGLLGALTMQMTGVDLPALMRAVEQRAADPLEQQRLHELMVTHELDEPNAILLENRRVVAAYIAQQAPPQEVCQRLRRLPWASLGVLQASADAVHRMAVLITTNLSLQVVH